jgi:hypothetical protein
MAAASESAHQANIHAVNARARRRWWNREGVQYMVVMQATAILLR